VNNHLPSPALSPPKLACRHFPACGGCQTLDIPYSRQLSEKQAGLAGKFQALADVPLWDILPSPATAGYRHKVQLPFGQSNSKVTLGCYAADSHRVVDQEVCLVQDRELTACVIALRGWANHHGLTVYDEKNRQGLLRHLILRKAWGTGEILAGVVVNTPAGTALPHAEDAVERLRAALENRADALKGLLQMHNTLPTNTVLGPEETLVWGEAAIHESLDGLRFRLGISTFFQINPFQAPRLFDAGTSRLRAGMRVLDLYCGAGAFTLWAARRTGSAEGWEENAASAQAARDAAGLNGLETACLFQTGEIAALIAGKSRPFSDFDAVLVDPPRKGLEKPVVESLVAEGPEQITYISCNPNSLIRDLSLLAAAYSIDGVQPVDMMPHTRHLECVAHLTRR